MTVRYFIDYNTDCSAYFIIHNMKGVILSKGKAWGLQGTDVKKEDLLKDDSLLDFEVEEWFVCGDKIHIMVLDEEEQEEENNLKSND